MSSSSDVSNYLHSTSTSSRADINKILTQLQQLKQPIEVDTVKTYIGKSRQIRLRSTTVTVGGPNFSETATRGRASHVMILKKPKAVSTYPLIHTTSGTLKFISHASRFGGRVDFDGSAYITIDNHSLLNVTDKITITGDFYLPAVSSGTKTLIAKDQQYRLELVATNTLRFSVYVSGAWQTSLTYVYTPNNWYEIVANYDSTVGKKLYVENVSQGSDALTGAMNTTTNKLGIGNLGDGSQLVPNNTRMSWVSLLHGAVNSTWISNRYNGVLDTKNYDEITTIPFIGDEDPQPNATTGLFVTS